MFSHMLSRGRESGYRGIIIEAVLIEVVVCHVYPTFSL